MREGRNIIVERWQRRLGGAGMTWGIVLLCLVPATAYYAWLICLNWGDFLKGPYQGSSLFRPVFYGLAFNSMLLHLLQGTFDVDPATIGPEGFVRNGLTYSLFRHRIGAAARAVSRVSGFR